MDTTRHQTTRIVRELRRRTATVCAVDMLSPRMTRITFSSPELAAFESASHDDHVKLFFPAVDGGVETSARDFTPRMFSREQQTLTIDFALHVHGPATRWARHARVGDALLIGGPRGSLIVPDDFDWYLLIGDESALPAIGRRVEELRAAVPVTTVVSIEDASDQQSFATVADWRPHWVTRASANAADESVAAALIRIVDAIDLSRGDGFIWIAAETTVARALRRYLIEDRRHPAAWLKAAAYWTRGRAGEHEPVGE